MHLLEHVSQVHLRHRLDRRHWSKSLAGARKEVLERRFQQPELKMTFGQLFFLVPTGCSCKFPNRALFLLFLPIFCSHYRNFFVFRVRGEYKNFLPYYSKLCVVKYSFKRPSFPNEYTTTIPMHQTIISTNRRSGR